MARSISGGRGGTIGFIDCQNVTHGELRPFCGHDCRKEFALMMHGNHLLKLCVNLQMLNICLRCGGSGHQENECVEIPYQHTGCQIPKDDDGPLVIMGRQDQTETWGSRIPSDRMHMMTSLVCQKVPIQKGTKVQAVPSPDDSDQRVRPRDVKTGEPPLIKRRMNADESKVGATDAGWVFEPSRSMTIREANFNEEQFRRMCGNAPDFPDPADFETGMSAAHVSLVRQWLYIRHQRGVDPNEENYSADSTAPGTLDPFKVYYSLVCHPSDPRYVAMFDPSEPDCDSTEESDSDNDEDLGFEGWDYELEPLQLSPDEATTMKRWLTYFHDIMDTPELYEENTPDRTLLKKFYNLVYNPWSDAYIDKWGLTSAASGTGPHLRELRRGWPTTADRSSPEPRVPMIPYMDFCIDDVVEAVRPPDGVEYDFGIIFLVDTDRNAYGVTFISDGEDRFIQADHVRQVSPPTPKKDDAPVQAQAAATAKVGAAKGGNWKPKAITGPSLIDGELEVRHCAKCKLADAVPKGCWIKGHRIFKCKGCGTTNVARAERDVIAELLALRSLQGKQGLELYCGGGGSGQGTHDAGGQVMAAFDKNPTALRVYGSNFPTTKTYNVDCLNVDSIWPWMKKYSIGPDRAHFWWISPKCAWSKARDQSKKDPSMKSYERISEALFRLNSDPKGLPDVIFGENVTGLEDSKDGVWEEFLKQIKLLGYEPHVARISTAHVGLPQDRPRLVHAMVKRSSKVKCFLERIANILRQLEPATLGEMFPDAECFFYDHRFGGRCLYRPDERIPSLRQRCLWRPSQHEESKKESSMDLVFADSMVWTVDSLKEVQGFPDAFRFDNVSDSIAASLIGLSVSPIVAQIVASSCDWNGSVRVKKKVEALERYLQALHAKKIKTSHVNRSTVLDERKQDESAQHNWRTLNRDSDIWGSGGSSDSDTEGGFNTSVSGSAVDGESCMALATSSDESSAQGGVDGSE